MASEMKQQELALTVWRVDWMIPAVVFVRAATAEEAREAANFLTREQLVEAIDWHSSETDAEEAAEADIADGYPIWDAEQLLVGEDAG